MWIGSVITMPKDEKNRDVEMLIGELDQECSENDVSQSFF